MYNLDSLTLKLFADENAEYFKNASVQKIQMPSKREILISLRNLGQNRRLYINIDPKFPHMCFIEDKEKYFIKIPKEPPMFCMLLRKHFENTKLKEARCVEYERIVEFYFETYDEIGSSSIKCFSVELMGKHSNAVLYEPKTGIILGSAHNISSEKSSVRELYGGIKYIYPPKQYKTDILKTSFAAFYDVINQTKEPLKKALSSHYYCFSEALLEFLLKENMSEPQLFKQLQEIAGSKDINTIKRFWLQNEQPADEITINDVIHNYFSKLVSQDVLSNKKSKLLKVLRKEIKKLDETLKNSKNPDKYITYKEKGEIILNNIYKIKPGDIYIEDNGIKVELDPLKTPSENAKRYFNLYTKGKNAKNIIEDRQKDALKNKEYLKEIVFCVNNADNPDILDEISDEINLYLNKHIKSNQKKPVNIKTVEYLGFEILIGKNNKQNDYIIKKLTHSEDLWFHVQGAPSGHIFVKTQNGKKKVPNEVLLYAAKLTKENSPLKESAKAGIIYTKRKYLKRPPETNLGYVTYREEKEIVV